MSDDNKNLSDDLDDMIGDAKDGAKRAGEKISSSAKEFSDDAKEFANDAKTSAKEFADDAKDVLSDGKNVAIIAHITLIGWIIAIVMNSSNKTEYGSFYVRQVLGIMLLGFVCGLIPVVNLIAWILPVAMWIMSLIGSLSGEKKPVFLLGNQFQDWFKGI
ncbi:YtxH domain-containing protein [Psychroserpens damuponensis]|uniref:YtxH domain-containing protein n=1 Tax=Psychroserpens damuponensis TaxID=943936 RepID=UPI00058E10C7|nr:YtxH domain-containing protein [Psychroserpens damuponensis]